MPATKKSRKSPKAKVTAPTFASVALVVSDRARAVEWYTKKLGLDLTASDDHWITVGRKGKGGEIHLCRTLDYDPEGKLEPGNSGIALRLAGDFEANCAAIGARGVTFSTVPTKEAWGWYAGVRDPDGNELWLLPES
jgi:catechol 2,3-dioxygenase-like lactoylglutathione lyase family enzyme